MKRASGASPGSCQRACRLDATIAEAATREKGSLPLLSVLLDTLYDRDVGRGETNPADCRTVMTVSTYRSLGELKGAIAQRADETMARLSAADEAAAAALACDDGAGNEVTAQSAPSPTSRRPRPNAPSWGLSSRRTRGS
jgi:hypothetical protein